MKRLVDVVGSAIGLVVLSPLLVVLAVLVRVRLGSPVLFRQIRPGLYGEPFELVKFRTMTDDRGADGELLDDEERMTPFGSWLRATSLDELPELLNVLTGDMSLVGPRPLLMSYLDLYSPDQARRHEVRPGLTGWSQVRGRNALSWEDKLALDTWYVDHQSLWLDVRILVETVVSVLGRRGIAADGHVTAPRFQGTPPTEPTVEPSAESAGDE